MIKIIKKEMKCFKCNGLGWYGGFEIPLGVYPDIRYEYIDVDTCDQCDGSGIYVDIEYYDCDCDECKNNKLPNGYFWCEKCEKVVNVNEVEYNEYLQPYHNTLCKEILEWFDW